MPLGKRMNCENYHTSTSEEQSIVCLEHQCSKSYLFSMLQDPPDQEYVYPVSVPCFYNTDVVNSNKYIQFDGNFHKTELAQPEVPAIGRSESKSKLHADLINASLDSSIYNNFSEDVRNTTSLEPHFNAITENEKHNFNKNIEEEKSKVSEFRLWEIIDNQSDQLKESYVGLQVDEKANKYMKKRKMGARCNCRLSERSTKFHCNEFTDNDRQALFSTFWEKMDWHQRKLFVSSLVKCSFPSARRKECQDPHRKEYAFQYHLRKNHRLLRVCKVMFINTLSIGEFSVRDWAMHNNAVILSQ
ncbi:uncharacterized protein TNIN_235861 [Trichonephila inaurata madagascariensis]|uniref:Uncharacterized protein n=1 Tax=Trichonephila inaurata madagascariensis TaxID=2747483 RepID=A0A8X6WN13_9ARAC|nr:uncharacterized protein TNIN_235861 [Trichonephila inaurata madagascariensis]